MPLFFTMIFTKGRHPFFNPTRRDAASSMAHLSFFGALTELPVSLFAPLPEVSIGQNSVGSIHRSSLPIMALFHRPLRISPLSFSFPSLYLINLPCFGASSVISERSTYLSNFFFSPPVSFLSVYPPPLASFPDS